MLQGGRHLAFGIKDGAPLQVPYLKGPRTKKLSGAAGYSTYVADRAEEGGSSQIQSMLPKPSLAAPATHLDGSLVNHPAPEGLFITESDRRDLLVRFPDAIAKMYALATQNKCVQSFDTRSFSQNFYSVKIVRGAISNGYEWAFALLQLNENGRGGRYKLAPKIAIDFERNYPNHVMNHGPDIVAGVLAHWVCRVCFSLLGTFTNVSQIEHCYDDLDENDWFKVDEASRYSYHRGL